MFYVSIEPYIVLEVYRKRGFPYVICLNKCDRFLFQTTTSGNIRPSAGDHTITVTRVLSFMAFLPKNLHFPPSHRKMSLAVSGKRFHFRLYCIDFLE